MSTEAGPVVQQGVVSTQLAQQAQARPAPVEQPKAQEAKATAEQPPPPPPPPPPEESGRGGNVDVTA